MIWELAGAIGIDPRPFTARELVLMFEGRERAEHSRQSALMALIANANRGRGRRPFAPADFDPYAIGSSAVVDEAKIEELVNRGVLTRKEN